MGERGRVVRRRNDVEVLARVGHAARAARDLHAIRRRVGTQVLDDLLADREHGRQQQPLGRPLLLELGQRAGDVLLSLRPDPRHRPQALLFGGVPQLLERGYAQLGVDPAGGLGAQAREAREPHQLAGKLRAQLHGRGDVTGLEQGADLLLESLPDVAQLGCAALAGKLRDGHRRVADRLGGLVVGDHPVDDGPVQLVEVAELVHRGRDLRVRHAANIEARYCRDAGERRSRLRVGRPADV